MNRYFVVIDTNVLVSALLTSLKDSSTVKVLEAVYTGIIVPIYNDEIIEEHVNVLTRNKFHFDNSLIYR